MAWFEQNPSYAGIGRADFKKSGRIIEGAGTARFNENGDSLITLEINYAAVGWSAIVTAFDILTLGECDAFSIDTGDGIFAANGKVFVGGHSNAATTTLTLHASRWQYEPRQRPSPHFWVIPLFNYMGEPAARSSPVDHHRLRLNPPPDIPSDLDESKKWIAELNAVLSNHVIVFHSGTEYGFIESLPDAEDRRRALQTGQRDRTITAIAVGTLDGSAPTWANLPKWQPLDIPSLLSVASGVQTGAAWVEMRSPEGALAYRLHGSFSRPVYHVGQDVLDESSLGRTGVFLSQALTSGNLDTSWLRVALRHLGDLCRLDGSLEERMWHVVLIFECYLHNENIGAENILNAVEVAARPKVEGAIEGAVSEIEDLVFQYPSSTARLRQIAQRVRGAAQKEKAFGLQVAELLGRRSFPDVDIVNGFYATTPRKDGIPRFESVVTKYRAQVVHEAYFDFLSGSFEMTEVYTVVRHLHDIALRLTFEYLGYENLYRSPITPSVPDCSANWVTPATSAAELGYGVSP